MAGESAHVAHILCVLVRLGRGVSLVHGVDHAARAEEQQRLEERMGHEVEHPGRVRAGADADEHVTELGHGGIREHALDVPLLEGDGGGEQRRERADPRDHGTAERRQREQHPTTGHQIDARGDHGGGVDQRGDGRRALHRVGEPDVQGDLGRLAGTAEEQEEGHRRHDRPARHESAGRLGEDGLEIERSETREDEKHRHEKPEVPDAVDDERLLARVGVDLVVEPEADEQVGAEPDPFPADEHHREVGPQDQRQHEEHEQIQIREVARITRVLVHVADAEDVDQRADTCYDEDHHGGELVELQREGDLQVARGHPLPVAEHERHGRVLSRELGHGHASRGECQHQRADADEGHDALRGRPGEGERAVHHEAHQRQRRHHPEKGQRQRGHQPLSRLMLWRLTVCRCR